MVGHVCSIVPPHLLEAMANSQSPEVRQLGAKTLAITRHLHETRHNDLVAKLSQQPYGNDSPHGTHPQGIIPNILLEHISKAEGVDDAVKESAAKSLAVSQKIRGDRQAALGTEAPAVRADTTVQFHRGVYDMQNQGGESDLGSLPGNPVRVEGQPPTQDDSVNQAYDNCLKVLDFYKKIFNYTSLDNKNMPVTSSVHFSQNYGNAFWTDEYQQMLYGDGDGEALYNFTACIDVIGHEMTHAVTSYNSRLQYHGESGALNEHISDVFGIMVKQMAENTTAEQSDWLIGEGCLMPDVKGVALRNMKAPGTAYNDPDKLGGKDPQPDNYATIPPQIKNSDEDNGGVHLLSGIPNKAFALSAMEFGGYSWEKAGKIWWITVTTHRIAPRCNFIQFADATVEAAKELFGDDDAKTVRAAWNEVGVVRHI